MTDRERIDILEGLCRELWADLKAAVSYIEDDSRSERRRQACLSGFQATLANAEQINRILEEVDQQERDDNGQFGAGA